MFSDGVKPGGDLAELDGSSDQGHRFPRRVSSSSSGAGGSSSQHANGNSSSSGRSRKHKSHRRSVAVTPEMIEEMSRSLIPLADGVLPPVVVADNAAGTSANHLQPADPTDLAHKFQQEGATVAFALNRNLRVHVTLIRNCEQIFCHIAIFSQDKLSANICNHCRP